mmetsp:Transcript_142415/g.370966  ORF Transcript_142415/g.370966 Transcript_142415/m.370966 type:complete len:316 (+) Transcript_142415:1259-2206(+)
MLAHQGQQDQVHLQHPGRRRVPSLAQIPSMLGFPSGAYGPGGPVVPERRGSARGLEHQWWRSSRLQGLEPSAFDRQFDHGRDLRCLLLRLRVHRRHRQLLQGWQCLHGDVDRGGEVDAGPGDGEHRHRSHRDDRLRRQGGRGHALRRNHVAGGPGHAPLRQRAFQPQCLDEVDLLRRGGIGLASPAGWREGRGRRANDARAGGRRGRSGRLGQRVRGGAVLGLAGGGALDGRERQGVEGLCGRRHFLVHAFHRAQQRPELDREEGWQPRGLLLRHTRRARWMCSGQLLDPRRHDHGPRTLGGCEVGVPQQLCGAG